MLVGFAVKNYRSFRDDQSLSMVASKDATHRDSLIQSGPDLRLSRVAAIYGANASGKSNLIKAMHAMERFVLNSATRMNLGDNIDVVSPFRLDASTTQKPSRFEITLLIGKDMFIYGFSATKEKVYDEWLHVRPSGKRRTSKWLDRTRDIDTDETSWNFRGPLKKDEKLLREKTRDNGLVLSRASELNVDAVSPLFLWFHKAFYILDLSFPPMGLAQATAKTIRSDESLRDRVVRFMHDADFGISGLNVSETVPFENLSDDAPAELVELIASLTKFTGSDKITHLSIAMEHSGGRGDKRVPFNFENDESNGTQRFFALAGPVLSALSDGDLLVIDELDCSMHPLLTRKIIELFQSPESNPNNAQLVFATHDSSIMDSSVFRRDQIWLAEKDVDGASELISLYDFDTTTRPRKSSAFEKNYLSGRYGAVPNFGPTLEDVEVE